MNQDRNVRRASRGRCCATSRTMSYLVPCVCSSWQSGCNVQLNFPALFRCTAFAGQAKLAPLVPVPNSPSVPERPVYTVVPIEEARRASVLSFDLREVQIERLLWRRLRANEQSMCATRQRSLPVRSPPMLTTDVQLARTARLHLRACARDQIHQDLPAQLATAGSLLFV